MPTWINAFLLVAVPGFALSCLGDGNQCISTRRYQSQTHYAVTADEVTSSGIQVDRSGQSYPSLEMIDTLVDDVEACLTQRYGDPPVLPQKVMTAYDCHSATFAFPFARECLTVKIPGDWHLSHDGTQELLPFAAPLDGCKAKGLSGDSCFWRAGLQCSNTVVSTPSMYVFKDPLIRSMTGCNNPWGVRIGPDGDFINLADDIPPELRLSTCASPGTSDVPPRSPLPGESVPDGFLGHQVDFSRTGCDY